MQQTESCRIHQIKIAGLAYATWRSGVDSQKKSCKQLGWAQRERLCALLQQGCTQQKIADALGFAKSTISREIRRNGGRSNYCPTKAQQRTTAQKKSAKKAVKVSKRHWVAIKQGLRLGWSPENIIGRMKAERFGNGGMSAQMTPYRSRKSPSWSRWCAQRFPC